MPKNQTIRFSDEAIANVNRDAIDDDRTFNYIVNRACEALGTTTPAKEAKTKQPRKAKAKSNKTAMPMSFWLDENMRFNAVIYWDSKERKDLDPQEEFNKFTTYCKANGSKYVDWNAAWRTWYTNAVKFNKAPTGNGNGKHRISDAERIANQAQSLFSTDRQREGGGALLDKDGAIIPEKVGKSRG